MAQTVTMVGLQREVMGKVDDTAPDHFPAMLSFDEFEVIAVTLSAQTGNPYGIPTEAEWELAARTFVNAREFIEQQAEPLIEKKPFITTRREVLSNLESRMRGACTI